MDEQFASFLDEWGNGTVWNEIQLFLSGRTGKVLDLACGTGRTYDFLKHNEYLEYYGCDISPLLIERAIKRGIEPRRLLIGDATRLEYADGQFEFLFSIGSLEHFSLSGLSAALKECKRVCSGLTFHQIPVSQTGLNEGWVIQGQSYWVNSERWWQKQFRDAFGDQVWTMSSNWGTSVLRGVWFITGNRDYFENGS